MDSSGVDSISWLLEDAVLGVRLYTYICVRAYSQRRERERKNQRKWIEGN